MLTNKTSYGITGNTLKYIAILTMLIDHTGLIIIGNKILYELGERMPQYVNWYMVYHLCRMIGRLSFPIFCFLLVEGFIHSRDWRKYAVRLGVFAFISEVPFDLVLSGVLFDWSYQNVFFTLLIGLLVIAVLHYLEGKPIVFNFITIFCGASLAWLLKTDYDAIGVILIALLYLFRTQKKAQCLIGASWIFLNTIGGFDRAAAAMAFIPVYLYHGERGKIRFKYIFYWFYPVHLLVLYQISKWM